MSAQLLPCPFCGAPGEIKESTGSQASGNLVVYRVSCSMLDHVSMEWVPDRKEAVDAWNIRTPQDESAISERDVHEALRHGFGQEIADEVMAIDDVTTPDQRESLFAALHGLKCNPVLDEIPLVMSEVIAILLGPRAFVENERPSGRERGGEFAARPTASLAAQCRMQARENLDPEYSRFMHAVADRLTGFGSLPESRKRTPVEWQPVVRDQRELQRLAGDKSAGGQMAREAADTIELLQQHKVWAIEWANRAVDSVKERMWAVEDGLQALVDYIANTPHHNAPEAAAARKLLSKAA